MHDFGLLLAAILAEYALPRHGFHGVVHWARVYENGLRIAEATEADAEIVALFAIFHDSRRVNEGRDRGHGERGGEFARSLRGSLLHLDENRFDLLYEACRLHTDGLVVGDITLLACWDADRLDLGRVGISPQRDRLGTDAARALIPWADERSTQGHVPRDVLQKWGIS